MEAALERNDRGAAERAANESASVADGGGVREVGEVGVGDRRGGFDLIREVAEAGAENDAGLGRRRPLSTDEGGGFGDLRGEVEHGGLVPTLRVGTAWRRSAAVSFGRVCFRARDAE